MTHSDLEHEQMPEATPSLQRFWEEGLVWLVNTAILHPRGYALSVRTDDNGKAESLGVIGVDEYWCFAEGETADVVSRYELAELAREARYNERVPQACTHEQPHSGPCNGLPCASVQRDDGASQ